MKNEIDSWNEYAKDEIVMLSEEMAEEIIRNHSRMFEEYDKYSFTCINVKVNELPSNLFVINDKGYGECCEKCGGSKVFLLIQPVRKVENPDHVVLVPYPEDVISIMTGQPPVVVECNEDNSLKSSYSWRCIKCAGWNEMKYDSNLGLMY